MNEEEKIKEELKSLYQRLYEMDKEFEKAKGKRFIITMLAFTAFYFVITMMLPGNTDTKLVITAIFSSSIPKIIAALLVSTVLAWFHFWINATIFGHLSTKSREERVILDGIRKQIKELEKKLED